MVDTTKRRSDRVLITLPVSVSGTDTAGNTFSEDATTVTVSQHGAALAMKTGLVTGQEVVLRRLKIRGSRTAQCRVVGQGGMHAGLQTFSVAFQEPMMGFWDIYFPPLPADKDTAGRTLLNCTLCGTGKIVHLHPEEMVNYNANRQLTLPCAECRKPTVWRESHQDAPKLSELEPANPERLAAAPTIPPENQRKHRRLEAAVLICVRQAGANDDVTTTEDISRGGVCFTSRRQYLVGAYMQVAVPYTPGGGNIFVDARVAHSSRLPAQGLYRTGIMYLAEYEPQA